MAILLRDIEPLRPLLENAPLGLISDIDGTIAPIVADPEGARATDICVQALRRLIQRGVRVVLVTGRTLEMARSMVPVEGASFAANHGLDLWLDGDVETPPGIDDFVALAGRVIGGMDG